MRRVRPLTFSPVTEPSSNGTRWYGTTVTPHHSPKPSAAAARHRRRSRGHATTRATFSTPNGTAANWPILHLVDRVHPRRQRSQRRKRPTRAARPSTRSRVARASPHARRSPPRTPAPSSLGPEPSPWLPFTRPKSEYPQHHAQKHLRHNCFGAWSPCRIIGTWCSRTCDLT
jgi:hypothetical protein